MLHAGVRNHSLDLPHRFATSLPFRHVVMDPFLDPSLCGELIAQFPSFEAGHSLNERGEAGRKAVYPNLWELGPAYQRFDRLMRDREFLSWISHITQIPHLLYDSEYLGGGTHENLEGQELDPHVDFNYHPRGQLHRRLNLIVFLNPEWDVAWGGCLELRRDPWATGEDAVQTVVPLANCAVLFETTESSWHGFRRIQLPPGKEVSRRSIAVYFYTEHRPGHEAAPSHGTVYYQRSLPSQIQPGYTLREEDVAEVQLLLARRDRQIQFLYDRELEFSKTITGITNSPSFRAGRALTWPLRVLRGLTRRRGI